MVLPINIPVHLKDAPTMEGNNLIPWLDTINRIADVDITDTIDSSINDGQYLRYCSDSEESNGTWQNKYIDYKEILNRLIPTNDVVENYDITPPTEAENNPYVLTSSGAYTEFKKYTPLENVKGKGDSTHPIYFDAEGIATPIESYSGISDSAIRLVAIDGRGKPIYNPDGTIQPLVVGKKGNRREESPATPVYFIDGRPAIIDYEIADDVPANLTETYHHVDQSIYISEPEETKEYPLIFGPKVLPTEGFVDKVNFINGITVIPSQNTIKTEIFKGRLEGKADDAIHADVATNAINDADGKRIDTTYIKYQNKGSENTPVYITLTGNTGEVLPITTFDNEHIKATYTPPLSGDGVDNTMIPNIGYVKNAIDEAIKVAHAMLFKGTIDRSNPLPFTSDVNIGWTFVVAESGNYKIGNNPDVFDDCEIGDMVVCKTIGSTILYTVVQTNLTNAVIGPGTSKADNIMIFTDNTGRKAKDSGKSLNDYYTKEEIDAMVAPLLNVIH